MDRRRFIHLAGLAGLAFVAPTSIHSQSRAAAGRYRGPCYLLVHAGGGWDPTFLCDPKGGSANPETSDTVDHYTSGNIGKSGGISYAPIQGTTDGTEVFYSVPEFFEKWHQRILVVNGIDTQTNNHDSGTRTTWSGQLNEGYPSFGALAAGLALEQLDIALPFLSSGGYDATEGVCSLARLGGADQVQRLAFPNRLNPSDANNDDTYVTPTTASRIAAAQAARVQSLRNQQTLPAPKAALSSLFLARQGNDGLGLLAAELAGKALVQTEDFPNLAKLENPGALGSFESLAQQAQMALLAFRSGVAVSANLNIGGFDTHGDHDDDQSRQLCQLLLGLDYIFKTIDQLGLGQRVYVLVGSDFGRTPYYNSGRGKDHWNVSSMMIAGPKVQGDRTIGGTDKGYAPMTVNSSLKLDKIGFRITPQHIQLALRKLAGISGTELDQLFPIGGDQLPFFG